MAVLLNSGFNGPANHSLDFGHHLFAADELGFHRQKAISRKAQIRASVMPHTISPTMIVAGSGRWVFIGKSMLQ